MSAPPPAPADPHQNATASGKDDFLTVFARSDRFRRGFPTAMQPTPDGSAVLFLRSETQSKVQSLYSLSMKDGSVTRLLDGAGHQAELSEQEKARYERQRITARGITHYQLSKDGAHVLATGASAPLLLERASGKVEPLPLSGPVDPQFSPDGKKLAYVKGYDLFILDLATKKEHRVTEGGTAVRQHGLAEFVAQEEMDRPSGYLWSPDGKWLAYQESDLTPVEELHTSDLANPEHPVSPARYPRAGKDNAVVRFGVISAGGGKTVWSEWDHAAYPYLTRFKWTAEGGLNLTVMNRRQTEELLLAVDPHSGKGKTLLTERDDAWINLDPAFPHWLEGGEGFLWRTERNGGPELELHAKDGTLKASWVKPEARLSAFLGVDPRSQTVYFTAQPTQPVSVLMRQKLGEAPAPVFPLTEEPLSQWGVLSHDGSVLVETTSSFVRPRAATAHVLQTGAHFTLPSVAEPVPNSPHAELRLLPTPHGPPEGVWSYLVRPHHAVPGKKLPVIVDVYGGPTHHIVTPSMEGIALLQWIADQGFYVVGFDNRGTPGRGRAWQRTVKGSLAGVILDDQVAGLQALAQVVPELDLSRVGVEGWSFGGYLSGLAVLSRPDIFKAAVAGAPVVDWRDYDTFYTERYLGLPSENAHGYDASSLLTYAPNLKGSLLLVHGSADDNVYFFNSAKLGDALLRAGRPYDFLMLSGATHMVPDPLMTRRLWERVAAYFHQHL